MVQVHNWKKSGLGLLEHAVRQYFKVVTHLVVWGTGNTCFVPMNSPHYHSNPPDWSGQEAGCCCTENNETMKTISVKLLASASNIVSCD